MKKQKVTIKAKLIDIDNIAKFVVYYFHTTGNELSHLKLQKLLYYIQAWHLVYFDKSPLFNNEPEAWVNGPVYREIYNDFKKHKDESIKLEVNDPTGEFEKLRRNLKLNQDQEELIDAVLHKYGIMSTLKLVFLTHTEKPWLNARRGVPSFAPSNTKISHNDMYNYYSGLVKKK